MDNTSWDDKIAVWGILDEFLEGRQINREILPCLLRDRRDGVCTVARFDGQRPVIIQGWGDKLQGSLW